MRRSQTSFRCTFCSKKFKGEDYLRKHINNKHEEEMAEFKDTERNKVRAHCKASPVLPGDSLPVSCLQTTPGN